MKIWEAFQRAMDDKVQRIEGSYPDEKGGFCARGLLLHYGIDPERLSSRIWADHGANGGIVMANDILHWTWKQFRDYAKKYDL